MIRMEGIDTIPQRMTTRQAVTTARPPNTLPVEADFWRSRWRERGGHSPAHTQTALEHAFD